MSPNRYAYFSEGEVNKGLRDVATDIGPGWIAKLQAEILGWFFDEAYDELYGEEAKKKKLKW